MWVVKNIHCKRQDMLRKENTIETTCLQKAHGHGRTEATVTSLLPQPSSWQFVGRNQNKNKVVKMNDQAVKLCSRTSISYNRTGSHIESLQTHRDALLKIWLSNNFLGFTSRPPRPNNFPVSSNKSQRISRSKRHGRPLLADWVECSSSSSSSSSSKGGWWAGWLFVQCSLLRSNHPSAPCSQFVIEQVGVSSPHSNSF